MERLLLPVTKLGTWVLWGSQYIFGVGMVAGTSMLPDGGDCWVRSVGIFVGQVVQVLGICSLCHRCVELNLCDSLSLPPLYRVCPLPPHFSAVMTSHDPSFR